MAYESQEYATLEDFYKILGLTAAQISALPDNVIDRFTLYVTEGNNRVEGTVSKLSNETPLVVDSDAFTFAKNATLNWALYKQRQFLGSANAKSSLEDFNNDIMDLEKILIKTRGDRTVTASIKGESQKNGRIILPSQIDTQFY